MMIVSDIRQKYNIFNKGNEIMAKTAIILGASGLTGSLLLLKLLEDSRYSKIKLFSRRASPIKHPKIEEHIIDLFRLEEQRSVFVADEVFCCIGTTKAKTNDETEYLKIDFGIPSTAAQLAAINGIPTFIVISALGADKNSKVFYNRTKGRMEEKVWSHKMAHTYILQPSLISGKREERRVGEAMAKVLFKIINPLLQGNAKKYRAISPETIVNTMIWLANNDFESGRIPSDEIQNISDTL